MGVGQHHRLARAEHVADDAQRDVRGRGQGAKRGGLLAALGGGARHHRGAVRPGADERAPHRAGVLDEDRDALVAYSYDLQRFSLRMRADGPSSAPPALAIVTPGEGA